MENDFPEYSKGIFFAICTSLCWAVLAIILKYTLTYSDAETIVWARMAIAGFILTALLLKKSSSNIKILFTSPPIIYLAACALAFNFYGYMKCIELTTASNTQIMIQIGPLLLGLSGVLFFKETLRKMQLLGFIVAFLGLSIFYRDQLLIAWNNKSQYIQGNLWILGAAITWAFFTIIQKSQSKRIEPQKILFVVFSIASLLLLPLVNFKHLLELNLFESFLIIFLGVNSWVAYTCLGEALKRSPASHVSLIITVNPLITIITIQLLHRWGLLFIPLEPINASGFLGAGLVMSGVALTVLTQKPVHKR